MEDVITEIPPPSRFFEADLNNLAITATSFSISLIPPTSSTTPSPLSPHYCSFFSISPPLPQFPSKILIGSLVLPEVPFSGNSVKPSLADNSGTICALCDGDSWNSTVLVSVQCPVAAERSHSVAKLLIGDRIIPQRVLVLDSVRSQNYRGWLSLFQAFALKLESSAERKMEIGRKLLKGLEYYPSGSVVD
ncbi:hypothetical protein L6164_001840 [Bauhinia variegata]|uniref:Uncharacterized protein n=1 Tax=Bauhinia variegata TaxID=167791 RepID=A0ACB9QC87_BAUVA|nr:hypothetical protein L6164_001840 [Bauhinia variegata]